MGKSESTAQKIACVCGILFALATLAMFLIRPNPSERGGESLSEPLTLFACASVMFFLMFVGGLHGFLRRVEDNVHLPDEPTTAPKSAQTFSSIVLVSGGMAAMLLLFMAIAGLDSARAVLRIGVFLSVPLTVLLLAASMVMLQRGTGAPIGYVGLIVALLQCVRFIDMFGNWKRDRADASSLSSICYGVFCIWVVATSVMLYRKSNEYAL